MITHRRRSGDVVFVGFPGFDSRRRTTDLQTKTNIMAEIRITVPDEVHQRVQGLQGLFTFKEKKKVKLYELYNRVIERGIVEFEKQNR